MSATGFQRRRRELAKAGQAEPEQSGVVTGGADNVPPVVTPPEQVPITEQATGLAALSKKDLLTYIGKKKLFDEQYKTLEPAAIIPLFLKEVQAKIVKAGLRTEIEAAALPEKELLELYETLK